MEKTNAYYNLQGQLRVWADEIAATIRKISISRNSDKTNKKLEKKFDWQHDIYIKEYWINIDL